MKLISVVTPCLNIYKNQRHDYFDKMMESIHNQSYKNIEHIIIDGGSDDGTLSVLEKYKKMGWIDCLISEKDNGIYDAINKGIKLSKGEYVNIMNTDDYFLDLNYFEKSIKRLIKFNYDFVHANRIIKSRKNKKDVIKKGNILNTFFRMPLRHQTAIVKKEVFNEVGLFDENYIIASDYKWVIKMIMINKKGYYFNDVVVQSLDEGVSYNRERCIREVSQILFESYGEKYGLTLTECHNIYLKKISFKFLLKIIIKVKDWKIKKSLFYCYITNLYQFS